MISRRGAISLSVGHVFAAIYPMVVVAFSQAGEHGQAWFGLMRALILHLLH